MAAGRTNWLLRVVAALAIVAIYGTIVLVVAVLPVLDMVRVISLGK